MFPKLDCELRKTELKNLSMKLLHKAFDNLRCDLKLPSHESQIKSHKFDI